MNIKITYTAEDVKKLITEDLITKGYKILKTPEINVGTECIGYGMSEHDAPVFKDITIEVSN